MPIRKPKFHIGDVIYDATWDNSYVVIANIKMLSGNYLIALEPLHSDHPIFYVVDCTLRAYPVFMDNPDSMTGRDLIGVFHSFDL